MPTNNAPKIGIIGAGFSGICAAIQLQKKLGIDSFTIFEQKAEVGGVWYTHTYLGCACDIPSHIYSFSFEPNPDWTCNHVSQPEILNYLKRLCKKHDIYRRTKLQHLIKCIKWDENRLKWIIRFVNLSIPDSQEEETMFDILIDAPGALRLPYIPPVFTSFQGPMMHSSEWKHDVDLQGKSVAVVGSGATAIQIIPSIVDNVKMLHSYQRKPPYVMPRWQFGFSKFVRTLFTYFPFLLLIWRFLLFFRHEVMFSAFLHGTLFHRWATNFSKSYRKYQLPDHEHLRKKLTPNFIFGCKRTVTSELYYPAMACANVHLHTSHVEKIVGQTIYTKDGQSQEVDVVILATGYRIHDYFDEMKVYGKGGEDIVHTWRTQEPRSFYAVFSSPLPNHFVILGPNSALGHNSIIFMIECQVNLIMSAIKEMMKRKAKCITLKLSAEDEFMEMIKEDMKATVWGKEGCMSWYANPRGVIVTLWPRSCLDYWRETKHVDWSKFEFI